MSTKTGKLLEMIEGFLKQRTAPGEFHSCPECAGKLRLQFEIYTRETKRLLGVDAECENCGLTVASDYAQECIPVWLQTDQDQRPSYRKLQVK